jgi:ribose 5-phosphate isomerase B
MRIALASDHAGYDLKQHLLKFIVQQGHEAIDLGVNSAETLTDYPDAAQTIGSAILDGKAERGILICGSGVGASIAANKIKGIYAAICHDTYSAAQGVQHDNMNVLCLGGRIIGVATAEDLTTAFLGTSFRSDVERYQRRFDKVLKMEE